MTVGRIPERISAMVRGGLLGVLVVSAIVATIASSGSANAERVSAGCLTVPRPMVAALKSGLKAKARGRLGTPRAVRSSARISFPRSFAAGTYFVSAKVRGFGIATWAASAEAFRTGGGFITVIDPVARRVSILGIDIPPSTVSGWGLSASTHGYAASRRCVQ